MRGLHPDPRPDAPGGRRHGARRRRHPAGPTCPDRCSGSPGSPAPSPSPTSAGARPPSTTGAGSCCRRARRRRSSSPRCASPADRSPGCCRSALLVWIGTVSYGAYLWHYPVYVFFDSARTGLDGLALLAVRFAAHPRPWPRPATTSSNARSCTARSGGRSRPSLRPSLPSARTVAVILAGTVVPARGVRSSTRDHPDTVAEHRALAAGRGLHHPADEVPDGRGLDGGHPRRRAGGATASPTTACGSSTGRPSGATSTTSRRSSPMACRPAGVGLHALATPVVRRGRPDPSGRGRDAGRPVGPADNISDGRVVHLGQPAWDAHLAGEINQAVDIFSAHGAKVVLFTMPDIDAADEAPGERRLSREQPVAGGRVERHRHQRGRPPRSSGDADRPQQEAGSRTGSFQLVVDGVTVRWPDGVHISKAGGEWLQPYILPTVGRLGLSTRAARDR